ncbi:hypothetical protein RD792_005239 [Penstemon davidsonii]|uniref:Uncharacterized protein n=1 Tax=Penstemon davidsonii TaxID=160366 RepID=A0ABR0DKE6_9LAMI|nr:hypothetical protein RD792_005239 [Penstemon davidsonii]
MDSSWLGLDGAGPSGFSRVQMVMRQLAAVGETYAQTGMDDSTWSLYPPNSEAGTSRSTIPPAGSIQYPSGAGSSRLRSTTLAMNDNLANIIAMAETVREVLPHIPDDIIFQIEEKLKFSPNGSKMPNLSTTTSKFKDAEVSRRQRVNVRDSSILSYEDLMETDYQQPRHKSPIHNK